MSLCVACGQSLIAGEICTWHTLDEPGSAETNTALCNFFHRDVPLVRVPKEDREEIPCDTD